MSDTKGIRVVNAKGAAQAKKLSVPSAGLSDQSLARVLVAQQQNENRSRPLTKTRGMVRGGGAKPWMQKGTGRARAGSNRSPIWKGGGVTFGPSGEPRRYKRIPQAVRRAARATILAKRAETGSLVVIAGTLGLQKTKAASVLREKVVPTGTILVVVAPKELDQVYGIRNLRNCDLTTTDDLTAADIARPGTLVVTETAYQALVSAIPAKPKAAAKPASPAKSPAKRPARKTAAAKPAKPAAKKPATKPAKPASKEQR